MTIDARADVYPGQPYSDPAAEQHVRLWVNGRDVSCDTLAQLSIRGGRSDYLAEADAATVSFTMKWPSNMPPPVFGDRVDIAGWLPDGRDPALSMAALFTGHITDIAIEDDWWSVVAADPLRRLTGVTVGGDTYPPETGWDRVERQWQQAKRRATEPWMSEWNIMWSASLAGTLPPNLGWAMGLADADQTDALQAMRRTMRPVLGDIYYRPCQTWPAPADPTAWDPTGWIVLGVSTIRAPQPPHIDCALIVADPPMRFWQNLGVVVNEWAVTSYKPQLAAPGQDPPQPIKHVAVARATDALRHQYGLRLATIDTDQQYNDPNNHVSPFPHDQAVELLKRTQVPDWSLDNVQVLFTRDIVTSLSRNQIDWAWRIVSHGAGQVGRYTTMGPGIPGTAINPLLDPALNTLWMTEQTQIDWMEDGWSVTLVLTPGSMYKGTVLDQRFVEVLDPPVAVPTTGGMLTARVVRPFDRQWAAGGTLQVDPGGTPVQTRFGWTALPIPDLAAGQHQLSVKYIPTGATTPAASYQLTVQAFDSLHWQQVPATRTWGAVPPAATWRHALAVDDIGGP